MGVHCCCLHVNYIVYKHFYRSLHVGSLDPTCVQNFGPVPLMVFEILGFKLKKNDNDNDNKNNWRYGLYGIFLICVVQFSSKFKKTYILTSAITLFCQKWIITENESAKILNVQA